MARQKSIFKIEGTLGDVSFYKSKDGFLVREKSGVNGDRIRKDPRFQRTRENSSEFGHAGKAGKTLRTSLRSLLKEVADYRMTRRLTQQMMRVIQLDKTSERGQRNVIDGETELLQGFDFNENASFKQCFFAPYEVQLERDNGTAQVEIESFVPTDKIVYPEGATHFKIVSAATAVDFEADYFISIVKDSGLLDLKAENIPPITLNNQLPNGLTHPLFYVLGVNFYQEVNDKMYPLNNGSYNALNIVKVIG